MGLRWLIFSVLAAYTIAAVIFSCAKSKSRGEELARVHCGSCHLFPEPALLDKRSWAEGVLPQMAFRMGFPQHGIVSRISPGDFPIVMSTVPARPMVDYDEWDMIADYYMREAPDSVSVVTPQADSLVQFIPKRAPLAIPFLTLLKFDSSGRTLYAGNQGGEIFRITPRFEVLSSVRLASAPSHIDFVGGEGVLVSLVGNLLPHDQALGKVVRLTKTMTVQEELFDSLQRCVHFNRADFDGDGSDEFVISQFGHYTGALTIHKPDTVSRRTTLSNLPGARRAEVVDLNGDGARDIVALFTQGDEKIVYYENTGKGAFAERDLVRFPPVYGSSYFELVDFNDDGHQDILYCNGDNADFSMVLKPYHGVRLFLNDGKLNFTEEVFLTMPGASQVTSRDFDGDGDRDIAAISYFPDFERTPERGFVYFENKGEGVFSRQTTALGAVGRWLVMETCDFDGDGDDDILLGSLSISTVGASQALHQRWLNERTPVLFLENEKARDRDAGLGIRD